MKKLLKWIGAIFCAILLTILIVGWTHPAFEYGNSIEVRANASKVFTFMMDTTLMNRWIPGFESLRLREGAWMQPGSSYTYIINDGERMVMQKQLEAIQVPVKLSYRLTNDVLISNNTFELTDAPEFTTVHTNYHVEGRNVFMKAVLYFSKNYLQNMDREMLERLKKEVER